MTAEWDQDKALFPPRILAYLQVTQPKLWGSMSARHGAELDPRVRAAHAKGPRV